MVKLTLKQQRFIQFYEGNATEAAIKAGYSKKTANEQGSQLLAKLSVHVAKRTQSVDAPKIMSRKERQELWSRIANDPTVDMNDRLRASELLGKSEADFMERYEHILKEFKYEEFKDKSDEELINDFRELGIRCEN